MKQITESYLRKIIQEETKKIFEGPAMDALRQRTAQSKGPSAGSKVAAAAGGAKKYAAGAAKAAAGSLGVPGAKAVGKGIMKDVGAFFGQKGGGGGGGGDDFASDAVASAKAAKGAKSDVQRAIKFMTVNKQMAPLLKNISKNPQQSAIFINQVMKWLNIDAGSLPKLLAKVKGEMGKEKAAAAEEPAAEEPKPTAGV